MTVSGKYTRGQKETTYRGYKYKSENINKRPVRTNGIKSRKSFDLIEIIDAVFKTISIPTIPPAKMLISFI